MTRDNVKHHHIQPVFTGELVFLAYRTAALIASQLSSVIKKEKSVY